MSEVEELIEEGLRQYGLGEADSALDLWERARALDPENPRVEEYISYVRRSDNSPASAPPSETTGLADLVPGEAPLHEDEPLYADVENVETMPSPTATSVPEVATDLDPLAAGDWGAMIADHLPASPIVVEGGLDPAPELEPDPVELTDAEVPSPPVEVRADTPLEPTVETPVGRRTVTPTMGTPLPGVDPFSASPSESEAQTATESDASELEAAQEPVTVQQAETQPQNAPVEATAAELLDDTPVDQPKSQPVLEDAEELSLHEFLTGAARRTPGKSASGPQPVAFKEPPKPPPKLSLVLDPPEGEIIDDPPSTDPGENDADLSPSQEEVPLGAPIGEPVVVAAGESAVNSPWDAIQGATATVDLDQTPSEPSVFDLLLAAEENDAERVQDAAEKEEEPRPVEVEVEVEVADPIDECKNLMEGARELFDLGDFSGSLALVEKCLELDPENAEAAEYFTRNESALIQMYESKLGDLGRCPTLLTSADEIIWMNLHHRAGFLLSQVDGEVSYEDLAAISGMSRLETFRILSDLVQNGVIG